MTARQYGKLPIQNWREDAWTTMTADAQWLYAYLESQSNTNSAGVFPIQLTKWAKAAADMTADRVKAAAKLLVESRYIVVDHDTEEGVLRTHIRDDRAGDNVFKGALDVAAQAQSPVVRAVLLREVRGLDREFTIRELELMDALEATIPPGFDFSLAGPTRTPTPTGLDPAVGTPSGRRPNAVQGPNDGARLCECGSHLPPMERGLCAACLGRELAQ